MIEATSCGGVVIHRGKILALYKSYRNRYEGWVLPKGTVEKGETFEQTALREVMEEAGVRASIVKYIGKTNERICYSRGIPTVICKKLSEKNIITAYKDYVEKYILFDNVIDWERDILRRTKYSQIRVIDVLCNPPRVA